jgi:hypothetical protein
MVGYGPHTVVPHMVSPIFTLLAQYMDNLQVSVYILLLLIHK